MKGEIVRRYPIAERERLVERLLERGVLAGAAARGAEPGQCCDTGCTAARVKEP